MYNIIHMYTIIPQCYFDKFGKMCRNIIPSGINVIKKKSVHIIMLYNIAVSVIVIKRKLLLIGFY